MSVKSLPRHLVNAILIVVKLAKMGKAGINEGKKMNAKNVAGYFVELASETPEHDLTNLKLQKLLYYAQGKYLARNNGKPFFDDAVEAWDYGPVVADAYHAFKHCGSFPVTVFDMSFTPTPIPEEKKEFIQGIWQEIGKKYSASFLVDKTHASGTPWKKFYKEGGRNITIPNNELALYFQSNYL